MSLKQEPDVLGSIPSHLRAFKLYNQVKTQNSLKDFPEQEKDAFHLIPYFLHTADPKAIGYINNKKAPAGIQHFQWKQDIQKLYQKYFGKEEKFDRRSSDSPPPIEFLSVMGSVGSIAFTSKSDLDYWVCVRPDLNLEQKELLVEKCLAIEDWCRETMDLEVHFFITSAKELAANQFGDVSNDSCGSALGKLLKEEYYRGSIHIAGKIPYWWIFPYGLNDELYERNIQNIENHSNPYQYEFIDIGNILEIPYEEFLGGGLWQINKGMGSAFKSALKMALLQDYSDPISDRELLATRLKRLVQKNPNQFEFLDSYQLLIDRVLEYYRKQDDALTIELLRRCFFLKIQPLVSRWWNSPNKPQKTSDAVMLEYCRQWYWQLPQIERLEKFNYLDIKDAREFKIQLEHFMLDGVRKLVERTIELSVEHSILPEDLLRMQNRLLAAFDSSRPKVEWYYSPFDHFIQNKSYTMRYISTNESLSPKWVLYSGEHNLKSNFGKYEEKQILLESNSLANLSIWLLYNQLINDKTSIVIDMTNNHRFVGNLKSLSKIYNKRFGSPSLPDVDSPGLNEQPVAKQWIISINLIPSNYLPSIADDLVNSHPNVNSKDEREEKKRNLFTTKPQDLHNEDDDDDEEETVMMDTVHGHVSRMQINDVLANIIDSQPNNYDDDDDDDSFFEPETTFGEPEPSDSSQSKRMRLAFTDDPLNAWDNKVSTLYSGHLIEKNTWGEVQINEFKGVRWLAKSLSHIISHCLKQGIKPRSAIALHFGQCDFDLLRLKPRCQKLVEQICDYFIAPKKDNLNDRNFRKAFCFEMGGAAHLMIQISNKIKVLHFPNLVNALAAINLHCCEPAKIGFDTGSSLGTFYQTAVDLSQQGRVDAFFQLTSKYADFIVIDELGHVINTQISRNELRAFFPRFVYSLLLCMQRVMAFAPDSSLHKQKKRLNISSISTDEFGKRKVKDVTDQSIEMVKPAIKRLKEVDLKLKAEYVRGFMMIYLYEGRLDFHDKETSDNYSALLTRVNELRKSHLGKKRKHYGFYLSDLDLHPDIPKRLENEDRQFLSHVSSWMCIKMSLEAAIARDSLNLATDFTD